MDSFETLEGSKIPLIPASKFIRLNCPPIFFVGGSKSGKTYAAVDFIYGVREECTSVLYITNTVDSSANDYLRKHVPRQIIRDFDVKLLWQQWNEILRTNAFYAKYTDQKRIDGFIQKYCARNPQYVQTKNDIIRFRLEFNRNLPRICSERDWELSENLKHELGAQYDPSKLSSPTTEDKQISKEFEEGFRAFVHDSNMKFIATHFLPENVNDLEDRNVVIACRSTRPNPIIILDDITAALSSAATDAQKIEVITMHEGVEKKQMQKVLHAFNALLKDMFTRGRHVAKVVLSLHSFKSLSSADRNLTGPVIVSTAQNISEMKTIHTQSSADADDAATHFAAIEKANQDATLHNKPHRYKLVYFPDIALSPYEEQKFAVLRCDAHPEPFEYGCETFRALLRETLEYVKNPQETGHDMAARASRALDMM